MSRTQRAGLIAVAAVIAVGAFFLLRPAPQEPAQRAAQTAEPEPTTTEQAEAGSTSTTTTTPEARPRPRPRYRRIRVRDGQPVGGPKTIRVRRGDMVRMAVAANAPDELHVHGYDLYEQVGPGNDGRLRFPARLEGVFEAELHNSEALVAQIEVRP